MRLTILSSVSVLALLCFAPVQAFSAFEFVAPKSQPAAPAVAKESVTITETQTPAPVVPAPVVESSHLPMPTTKESAADIVKTATHPKMDAAQFGDQAVPLTPVVRESDALVIDTRVPSNRVYAQVQDLPPLPPMPKQEVAALSNPPAMPSPVAKTERVPRAMTAPAAIPAPVMPSNPYDVDVPVSSFGVVPDMQETVPVTAARNMSDETKTVQGFGRDVPLVLALQQIVPPSYRYSFDDGISPGMRISWSGDRPWKDIIMEIAQHNNMNVDIVSNVVAFHRGGASSAAPVAVAETRRETVTTTREFVEQPSAPSMPSPVIRTVSHEPVPVLPPAVRATENKKPAFDSAFGDDVPASGKVENKKILTADASSAVRVVDEPVSGVPTIDAADDFFAAPMPLAPITDVEAKTIVTEVPRSSSRNLMPEAAPNVASAPDYVETDMTSSREWQAFKGETLRQALTAWSNNAGVSLVWSSEYDYPLQTDVRIASGYTDAVRTLLAGFSKAQPRPLGRLFDNKKSGAQPVLIVETQRLTN